MERERGLLLVLNACCLLLLMVMDIEGLRFVPTIVILLYSISYLPFLAFYFFQISVFVFDFLILYPCQNQVTVSDCIGRKV